MTEPENKDAQNKDAKNRDAQKRGYLYQDFRYFHLKDQSLDRYEYHFHEFNKVIFLLSGQVRYLIEGKTWFLKPGDLLLVNHHDIHKPVMDGKEPYERIILWINPDYIRQLSKDDDLSISFSMAGLQGKNLIRSDTAGQKHLRMLFSGLESAVQEEAFGSRQLAESWLIQLLVLLGRRQLGGSVRQSEDILKYDPKVEELLQYIKEHLKEDLNIVDLAARMYVSRYYLMHRFKEETGYTIYNYITQKRLSAAREKMNGGASAAEASIESGFRDYSSFLRAFKKQYGTTPTAFIKEKPTFW